MRKMLLFSCLLSLGLGCGAASNELVGVSYLVSERPMSGLREWSCLSADVVDGEVASSLAWSVGASLNVSVAPRFAHACGGAAEACPESPQWDFSVINPSAWKMTKATSVNGTASTDDGRSLEAVAPGDGGIQVSAKGRTFPALMVRAFAPGGFEFFRAEGEPPDVKLTAIGSLSVPVLVEAVVIPRLRRLDGTRLCGFPSMDIEAVEAGVVFEAPGRANAPVLITASDVPGDVFFRAAGVNGDLPIELLR